MRAVFHTINSSRRVGTIGKLVQSETSYNHSWSWNYNIQECVPPAQRRSCWNFLSVGKLCDCACHESKNMKGMCIHALNHSPNTHRHTHTHKPYRCICKTCLLYPCEEITALLDCHQLNMASPNAAGYA